jgi:hypothetical protein
LNDSNSQVFDPLANAIDGLKQQGFRTVNSPVNPDGDAENKSLCDGTGAREGSRLKHTEPVELEHPNLGAGYVLPLLQHLVGELKSILDGEVRLETCRPLAFYVFHGLMERYKRFSPLRRVAFIQFVFSFYHPCASCTLVFVSTSRQTGSKQNSKTLP